jgi:hypothetical protein
VSLLTLGALGGAKFGGALALRLAIGEDRA